MMCSKDEVTKASIVYTRTPDKTKLVVVSVDMDEILGKGISSMTVTSGAS